MLYYTGKTKLSHGINNLLFVVFKQMSIYSQLNFKLWGGGRNQWLGERVFETWGIQYNYGGTLLFASEDGELREYSGSWAFLTMPGKNYCYGAKENQVREHLFVTFTGERTDDYVREGLWPEQYAASPIRVFETEKMFEAFSSLHKILDHGASPESAVNLIDRILFIMAEQCRINGIGCSGYFHALASLQERIRTNPLADWDFRKESKKFGVSYPHFRRIFEQSSGMPPLRFLKNRRLSMAAERLLDTDEQVQRIAEECGFHDLFLFSKQFKARFGVSPLKYRYSAIRSTR